MKSWVWISSKNSTCTVQRFSLGTVQVMFSILSVTRQKGQQRSDVTCSPAPTASACGLTRLMVQKPVATL